MSIEYLTEEERRLLKRGFVLEVVDSYVPVISIGDGPCVDAEGNPHPELIESAPYTDICEEWGDEGIRRYFEAEANFKGDSWPINDSDRQLLIAAGHSEVIDEEEALEKKKRRRCDEIIVIDDDEPRAHESHMDKDGWIVCDRK